MRSPPLSHGASGEETSSAQSRPLTWGELGKKASSAQPYPLTVQAEDRSLFYRTMPCVRNGRSLFFRFFRIELA